VYLSHRGRVRLRALLWTPVAPSSGDGIMTETLIGSHASARACGFAAVGAVESGLHVVRVSGELDVGGRDMLIQTCARAEELLDVVVDLSELTFMDCAGYGALITARAALSRHGGTLTLANGVGEPAALIAQIGRLERCAGQNVVN
jgi:anti-sigma B factor antagonist